MEEKNQIYYHVLHWCDNSKQSKHISVLCEGISEGNNRITYKGLKGFLHIFEQCPFISVSIYAIKLIKSTKTVINT